jgi:putative toxin-antitoxin system antitoxin component (TIGR02293 family)
MIPIDKIAQVLGAEAVLRNVPRSQNDLRLLIEHGLPKQSGLCVLSHLFKDRAESRSHLYELVPEPTFKRRKEFLKTDESEKIERLARVIATAYYVLGDDAEQVRSFFLFPHLELNGETPYQVSRTELGARQIEELLWKIFYGIPV